MKSDMELIRKILLKIEEATDPSEILTLTLEGYSGDQIHFHLKLLSEAGLIHAIDASSKDGIQFMPRSITWEGYEFLEAVRDDGRWQKVKDTIIKKGGAMVFDVVKAVAVDAIKKAVLL